MNKSVGKEWRWPYGCLVIAMLLVVAIYPAFAGAEEKAATKSGYEDVPRFGGPGSVGDTLTEDDKVGKPWFRLESVDRFLKPWFDWKGGLNKKYGLSLGLDYTALGQRISESPGEDTAAGGIFRFFGNWTVVGRDSGNTGSVVYKIENRHTLGTDIPPQDLGFEAGYLGIPGTAFSDYDGWGLTNLYWKQRFNGGRTSFVAGAVDATDYLAIYGMINPWTQFQNLVFLTDPTIPAPNQGLGAAAASMVTDNFYLIGGLADSNGDPTEPGDWFETFFDDREYFYHAEFGWTASQERIYFDNIHLTAWYADEREAALVEDGWGMAFSATKFVNDTWMPFVRAGYSDGGGALLESHFGGGVGYYFGESKDLLGVGLDWGRPPESTLDDQYTAEIFYRLQLAQNLALTPSLQYMKDPALNPDEDNLWLLGLRLRFAL